MEEKMALTQLILNVIGIVINTLAIITTIIIYLASAEKKK